MYFCTVYTEYNLCDLYFCRKVSQNLQVITQGTFVFAIHTVYSVWISWNCVQIPHS